MCCNAKATTDFKFKLADISQKCYSMWSFFCFLILKFFLFRKSPSSPAGSPTGLFGTHQKDLSYDDLSKNIDANLAEIDMETFRSEDINSILALPAIYSGDFQSASHGEQCASVSGSLLNGLELDTSARFVSYFIHFLFLFKPSDEVVLLANSK